MFDPLAEVVIHGIEEIYFSIHFGYMYYFYMILQNYLRSISSLDRWYCIKNIMY